MRSLTYDKNLDKYVLYIEEETDLKHNGKIVGKQKSTIKQIWDKDQLSLIQEQIKRQKIETENKLKEIEAEIKTLKITDREKKKLSIFYENMIKSQKLQKLQQLEQARDNHKDALTKISKDLKELENAIKPIN